MRVALMGLALAACGGTTTGASSEPFPTADGGGGGSGGSTLVFGSGGSPRVTDAGSSGGARMHAESCEETRDFLKLDVVPADGHAGTVRGLASEYVFDGTVIDANEETFHVDTCPDADCADKLYTVTLSGPYLKANEVVEVTKVVHVRFRIVCAWTCTESLYVGAPAPTPEEYRSPAHYFYFYGEEGGGGLEEAPYTAEHVPLDCPANTIMGVCGDPAEVGLYALRFTMKETLETTLGYMGRATAVMIQDGAIEFHDVRSYVTGACDDYWNWAHWARRFIPLR